MENSDKAIAETINAKAKDIHVNITKYLSDHDIQNTCYAYKSRVKSKEALLEKIDRKKADKPDYDIYDISDVIGVRFIVLFKQDIIPTIKSIIDMLTANTHNNNPFKSCHISEAIYYKGNISSSNISTEIKKSFTNINTKIEEKASPEGYSSIHIVCELETEKSDILRKNYKIPVEIQVRTVFEDAWGEIDHKYGYSCRRVNTDSHPTLDKHLQTLKQFVDACIDYADLIVEESKIEINSKDYSKVLSVPSSTDDIFSSLKIDNDYIDDYKQIIKIKNQFVQKGNSLELTQCADNFLSLQQKYMMANAMKKHDIFSFYCGMNSAFCNLAANTQSSIKLAKDMYLELLETDPNNSLLLMRLGQTMGKIGDFDQCIEYLYQSFEKAKDSNSEFKVKQADIQYVLSIAPKIAGYYIWFKIYSSENSFNINQLLKMYQQAYDFSLKGFEYVPEDSNDYIDYLNNLVFYLTEIYKIDKNESTKEKMLSQLQHIESKYDSTDSIDATILHTLLNSYYELKNIEKCQYYMQQLREKILTKQYEFDDSEAIDMMRLIEKVRMWLNKNKKYQED